MVERGQPAVRRAVQDGELRLPEVVSHRGEALVERVVEDVVVADGGVGSRLVERVLLVVGHLEVRADQIHRAEPEVVQEPQRHEHHGPLALDAKRVLLRTVVAPADRVLVQEAPVVEVLAAPVEQDGRHLLHAEGARLHGAVRLLNPEPAVPGRHRHELQDARILPACVDEPPRRIDASPERWTVHRPRVVHAHRHDAACVELGQIVLRERRPRQDEERLSPTVEVGQRDAVEVRGVEAYAALGRSFEVQARLQRRDVSVMITHATSL